MTRTIAKKAIKDQRIVDLTVKVLLPKFVGRRLAHVSTSWLMNAPQRSLELIPLGLLASQKSGSGASPEINTACRCPRLQ
jgi:hypothetical protein